MNILTYRSILHEEIFENSKTSTLREVISGILASCVVWVLISTTLVDAATMEELESRIAGLEQALERAEQE